MKTNLIVVLAMVCTMIFISVGNVFASKLDIEYKIQDRDTLSEIAQRYHGKNWRFELGRIAVRNNIQGPRYVIIAGNSLIIPARNVAMKKSDMRRFHKHLAKKATKKLVAPAARVETVGNSPPQEVAPSKDEKSVVTDAGSAAMISEKKTEPEAAYQTKPDTASPAVEKVVAPAAPDVNQIDLKEWSDLPSSNVAPIEIIYTRNWKKKAVEKTAEVAPSQEIADEPALNQLPKNIQAPLSQVAEPIAKDGELVKFEAEIGYYYGGLELPGSQGFGGSVTFFKKTKTKHMFGLHLGAELIVADITDIDSKLRRMQYNFFGGGAYEYQTGGATFSMKTGLMHQNTNDTITAGGFDPSSQTSLTFAYGRDETAYLIYNKMKYEQEYENWLMNIETEVRYQLSAKFKTDLPTGSMGSSKFNQSLAVLKFDLLRKIGANMWIGAETKPLIWAAESKMFGTELGVKFVYKHLILEAGWLFNPFGFPHDAEVNKATFKETQRARIVFKFEF